MEREFDQEILELICKPIKNDLNCLISISGHKLLRADIVMFKVVLRKWFNRFHTSQISRRFSVINSHINQFVKLHISENFSTKLGSLIREKFDTRSGKLEYPTYDDVAWIMSCSTKACEILCKTIREIISVFEDCTLWIKLGHFARQMRIITAAVSRLSVFFKTIVMKIADVYPYLYSYLEMLDYVRLEEDQLSREIFHYLERINVERPKQQEIRSNAKAKFKSIYESGKKNEDLGQKVSRNLFNQKTKQPAIDPVKCDGPKVVPNGDLGRVRKNEVTNEFKGGAFNFLTNGGFLDTLGRSRKIFRDEESSDRSSLTGNDSKEATKRIAKHSRSSKPKVDSKVDSSMGDHSTDDSSMNTSTKTNDTPSDASDDLPSTVGSSGSDRKLARKSSKRTELLKKSRKRIREDSPVDSPVDRAEVKALIEEFKRRESIKKAKRRRLIRESMKFEVRDRVADS